jgi:hypothetical protein
MSNHVIAEELEEIAAARQAAADAAAHEPRAKTARYDPKKHEVVIGFTNGAWLGVPADHLQGLAGAPPEELDEVEITPSGTGLHWETLDVDMHIPGLLAGVFGTRAWMAALGRKGGRITSSTKAAAAKANGQKGGRPRKH